MRNSIEENILKCQAETLIVSSEDLSILPEEGLAEMHRFLYDKCSASRITIVGLARDPFDYLQSSIQQYIKPGLTSLEDITENIYRNYSYQSCPGFGGGAANILMQIYLPSFERFAKEFGVQNCNFRRFEDVTKTGLANFVLCQSGDKARDKTIKELRSNSSMSAEAAALISVYNSENERYNGGKNVGPRNIELVDLLKSVSGRKAVFPVQISDSELSDINSSIDKINDLFGSELMRKLDRERIDASHANPLTFSKKSVSDIYRLIEKLMSEHNVNDALAVRYRDAGIKLYDSDPEVAYLLLKRAAEIRPNGKLIDQLLKGLERKGSG